MAVEQLHIIQRQIFEVEYFSREKAHQLQDRISALYNNRISPALSVLFDHTVMESEYLNIDSLTVDLNILQEDWDDETLVDMIVAAVGQELSRMLANRVRESHADESLDKDQKEKRLLRLLEYFLLNGSSPWWVTDTHHTNWETMLLILFSTAKAALRALIIRQGSFANVRQRMAYQFSQASIRLIVELIEPEDFVFIQNVHTDLSIAQHQQQLVKNDTESFERALWEFILSYLLLENQSFFNRLSFLESTLKRLASHFNLTYQAVLTLFSTAIPLTKKGVVRDLPELLFLLSMRHYQGGFEFTRRSKINPEYPINVATERFQPAADRLAYHQLLNEIHLSQNTSHGFIEERGKDFLSTPYPSRISEKEPGSALNEPAKEKQSETQRVPERGLADFFFRDLPESLEQVYHNKMNVHRVFYLPQGARRMLAMEHYNTKMLANTYLDEDYVWALVAYYLRFGSLPSWIAEMDQSYFSFNIYKLVTATKSGAGKLTAVLLSNPQANLRLMQALSMDELYILLTNFYDPQTLPEKVFFTILLQILLENHQPVKIIKQLLFGDSLLNGLNRGSTMKQFDTYLFLEQISQALQLSAVELHNLLYPHLPNRDVMNKVIKTEQTENQSNISLNRGKTFNWPVPEDNLTAKTDLFTYYLINGTWPWWYEGDGNDFSRLFKELVRSAPKSLIKLITYSGDKVVLRYRLLTAIAPEELMEGFAIMFSQSGDGLKAYRYISEKLQKLPLFSLRDKLGVMRNLTGIYWEVLLNQQYKAFDTAVFLREALRYVAITAGVDMETVIKQLAEVPGQISMPEITALIIKLRIEQNPHLFLAFSQSEFYEVVHQSDFSWIADSNAWLKPSLLDGEKMEGKLMMEFYKCLINKQELYGVFGFGIVMRHNLILALLDMISGHKKRLGNQENAFSPGEKFIESLIALETLLESALNGYQSDAPQPAIETGLNALKESLNMQDGELSAAIIRSTGQLALMAIGFFIKNGTLPSHYSFSNLMEEQILLKQLMRVALKWDSQAVRLLFTDGEYNTSTIEKLATSAYLAIEDNELIALTAGYIQRYLPEALRKLGFVSKMVNDLNVKTLFGSHQLSGNQEWVHLLSHRHIRLVVAKSSSIVDLIILAGNRDSGWGSVNLELISNAYNWMSAQMSDTLERLHLQTLFKEFFILQFFTKDKNTAVALFFNGLLKFIASERIVVFQQLLKAGALKKSTDETLEIRAPDILIAEVIRAGDTYLQGEQIRNKFGNMELDRLRSFASDRFLSGLDELDIEVPSFESDFELSGESFSIHNAGLVLLHPYLKPFFTNLGLLKEGKFISMKARFKAIHTLQYLIDGQSEHPEEILMLNKILCGWPVKAPVSLKVRLSKDQKKHCEDFLSAVIGMWEQMKNSSHANFRGAFLKRNGLLRNDGGDWNLSVEPTGYDILLQTLPWGYGVIKNSIMESTIYVEWQA